ncbi:hypothetical protein GQ56_0105730 [Burkholderia paludis]|nr:hypothetical protein GQ56_0105730 [Burkholderia paludis]
MLIGLTAANLRALVLASADSPSLPQSATAIASQIGISEGHGSSAAAGAMDGAIVELAHRAYSSALHSILGVLAVFSILAAVVCIMTLRQPIAGSTPAPETGVR